MALAGQAERVVALPVPAPALLRDPKLLAAIENLLAIPLPLREVHADKPGVPAVFPPALSN
jgi:hypothetical protein